MTGKLPDPENHAAKGFGPPHSWALRNRRSASGEKHGNHRLFGSSRKNLRSARREPEALHHIHKAIHQTESKALLLVGSFQLLLSLTSVAGTQAKTSLTSR